MTNSNNPSITQTLNNDNTATNTNNDQDQLTQTVTNTNTNNWINETDYLRVKAFYSLVSIIVIIKWYVISQLPGTALLIIDLAFHQITTHSNVGDNLF